LGWLILLVVWFGRFYWLIGLVDFIGCLVLLVDWFYWLIGFIG
jgi:hypothetical protein